MTQKRMRVLLAAEDPGTIAEVTEFVSLHLEADLTIADGLEQAEVLAAGDGFDLALVASELPDGNGLDFLRRRNDATSMPVFIIEHQPDAAKVLATMRAGAADVFTRPFDVRHMRSVVRRAVGNHAAQRKQEVRNRRLRRLSSRLVRDRRELRQRINLICRDVVLAYRRLVDKTMKSPNSRLTNEPRGRIDSMGGNS